MLELSLLSVLFLGGVIVVSILVLGLIARLLLGIILLPFKLVGAVFGALAGVFGALAKVLIAAVGLLAGVVLMAGGLVVLPLLPVVFLVLVVWMTARLLRPNPQAT